MPIEPTSVADMSKIQQQADQLEQESLQTELDAISARIDELRYDGLSSRFSKQAIQLDKTGRSKVSAGTQKIGQGDRDIRRGRRMKKKRPDKAWMLITGGKSKKSLGGIYTREGRTSIKQGYSKNGLANQNSLLANAAGAANKKAGSKLQKILQKFNEVANYGIDEDKWSKIANYGIDEDTLDKFSLEKQVGKATESLIGEDIYDDSIKSNKGYLVKALFSAAIGDNQGLLDSISIPLLKGLDSAISGSFDLGAAGAFIDGDQTEDELKDKFGPLYGFLTGRSGLVAEAFLGSQIDPLLKIAGLDDNEDVGFLKSYLANGLVGDVQGMRDLVADFTDEDKKTPEEKIMDRINKRQEGLSGNDSNANFVRPDFTKERQGINDSLQRLRTNGISSNA